MRMVEAAYVNEAGSRGHRGDGLERREAVGDLGLMKYQTTERCAAPSTTPWTSTAAAPSATGRQIICNRPIRWSRWRITVEGANILTRTLITFAQGALRSHPYLYQEIQACQDSDSQRGLAAFERAFLDHVSFSVSNTFGAFFHNITGGQFATAPTGARQRAAGTGSSGARSRSFAFVADLTVALLGGGAEDQAEADRAHGRRTLRALPTRVRVKRFEDDGKPDERSRHRRAGCGRTGCYRFQEALRGGDRQFPGHVGAQSHACRRLPAGRTLSAGARPARSSGRRARARARASCATG